ncbi:MULTISPECIES: hypothetical protein [unclassified Streptomyces]|nr:MULTISPECIES: hypothetical protein [unclassified Streptomyces]MDN3247263.1 hypothetical protein [Streptomyces sp. ZSW22]MDN3256936.1 hypothetical protein [Streptomyces sp. MA25(2023)]
MGLPSEMTSGDVEIHRGETAKILYGRTEYTAGPGPDGRRPPHRVR